MQTRWVSEHVLPSAVVLATAMLGAGHSSRKTLDRMRPVLNQRPAAGSGTFNRAETATIIGVRTEAPHSIEALHRPEPSSRQYRAIRRRANQPSRLFAPQCIGSDHREKQCLDQRQPARIRLRVCLSTQPASRPPSSCGSARWLGEAQLPARRCLEAKRRSVRCWVPRPAVGPGQKVCQPLT